MDKEKEYFNSIKVRLRLRQIDHAVVHQQFQFHKGSIKTVELLLAVFLLVLFQFHKGSIKTNELRAQYDLGTISIP